MLLVFNKETGMFFVALSSVVLFVAATGVLHDPKDILSCLIALLVAEEFS
jgi:hypothetical protein